MGCGAAEATGLGFVCCQPTELIWGFLFQKFSNFTPPPPQATDLHVMDEVVSCVDNLSADSVVVIDDHVNLSGERPLVSHKSQKSAVLPFITPPDIAGLNPLFGPNEATFGTRFPDMSTAYDNASLLL